MLNCEIACYKANLTVCSSFYYKYNKLTIFRHYVYSTVMYVHVQHVHVHVCFSSSYNKKLCWKIMFCICIDHVIYCLHLGLKIPERFHGTCRHTVFKISELFLYPLYVISLYHHYLSFSCCAGGHKFLPSCSIWSCFWDHSWGQHPFWYCTYTV